MNAPTAFPDQKPVPPYKHTPLFPLGAGHHALQEDHGRGRAGREGAWARTCWWCRARRCGRCRRPPSATSITICGPGHLKQLRSILDDKEASDNDKFVAFDFLKNANIAAGGVLPMCQDTGTAIIMGKKGCNVITDGDDEAALSRRRARRLSAP